MNSQSKRMVIAFVPWIVASVLIYALGSLRHLRAIQTVAFIATFLGILFCILTYRSTYPAVLSCSQVRIYSHRVEHNCGGIALLDHDLGTVSTFK